MEILSLTQKARSVSFFPFLALHGPFLRWDDHPFLGLFLGSYSCCGDCLCLSRTSKTVLPVGVLGFWPEHHRLMLNTPCFQVDNVAGGEVMFQKYQIPQSNTTASNCVAVVSAHRSNCRPHELNGLTRDPAPCPVTGGSNALVHTALLSPFVDSVIPGCGSSPHHCLWSSVVFLPPLWIYLVYFLPNTPVPTPWKSTLPQSRGGTGILSRKTLAHPSCPEVREIALRFCWLAFF